MTLAQFEHLMVALAAVCFVMVVAWCGVGVARLRRRWRRKRSMLRQLLQRPIDLVPMSRFGDTVASTVASPTWWRLQHGRHSMWRSVAAARRTVSVAVRADAPVGDLVALSRQLQRAASDVDAALRASGCRQPSREVTLDRRRIEKAADDIRAAALASLSAMRPDVQQVASAITIEVAALAAGIQAARSAPTTVA